MGKQADETTEFAIANVQCQYDSSSDVEECRQNVARPCEDHNYDTRDEPPAFIIQHIQQPASGPYVEVTPKMMTFGPGYIPSVNVIHVGDRTSTQITPSNPELNINKRIRRSEVVLKQAADCVSQGLTFQTVSEKFNIPISTIRFFMARKGILPRRRRGRSSHYTRTSTSPEPPFHMQHFKLPGMVALSGDDDENTTS